MPSARSSRNENWSTGAPRAPIADGRSRPKRQAVDETPPAASARLVAASRRPTDRRRCRRRRRCAIPGRARRSPCSQRRRGEVAIGHRMQRLDLVVRCHRAARARCRSAARRRSGGRRRSSLPRCQLRMPGSDLERIVVPVEIERRVERSAGCRSAARHNCARNNNRSSADDRRPRSAAGRRRRGGSG